MVNTNNVKPSRVKELGKTNSIEVMQWSGILNP